MEERDFALLRALEQTGNITRAAELLFTTQSALSKRIKLLEEELGEELLVRSRQGVRFTPAGELVLRHSAAAARTLEEMRRELEESRAEICGTLNAGFSINYARYILPDLLTSYSRCYPRVSLCVSTGQSRHLYRQMLEGSIDLAVLRGEYAWDGYSYLLSQEEMCLVYSRERQGQSLQDFPYIGRQTDAAQEAQILRWLRENGLHPPASGLRVDNIGTCLELARRGLGWAILPQIALDGFEGCIRPLAFAGGEPFVRRTYLLCQASALRLPQVSAFAALLHGEGKGNSGGD